MDRNDYYGGESASLNLTQVGSLNWTLLVQDANDVAIPEVQEHTSPS